MATRPIVDTLRELRNGVFLDEASEALAEVVRQVRRTGRAGSLAMTLAIKPAGRGNVTTVMVEAEVKAKPPQLNPEVTLFFPTDEGNLCRNDPRQQQLWPPARSGADTHVPEDVDTVTGEIRERA